MKSIKHLWLATVIVAFSLNAFSQMAVVEYMKVKPGDASKYLAVESAWKKIHEARLKAGQIVSWTLYEHMFAGADDPYQYATVTVYKDMAAYENASSDSVQMIIGTSAYPNYKDKDWDNFYEKTGESRVLSQAFVYHMLMGAEGKPAKPTKYLQLSNMNVKSGGSAAYENLEKTIFKPLHEAAMKTGKMQGWSVWYKSPGDYTESQYTTVNNYSSLAEMGSLDYGQLFKSKFPTMSMTDVMKKTEAARTIVQEAVWKIVDIVIN